MTTLRKNTSCGRELSPPRRRRRALVMVLVLWMIVVLGVLAASLAFDVQISSKLVGLRRDDLQAYMLAKSGVSAGMVHLQNDLLNDQAENPNTPYDAYSDVWYTQGLRNEKDRVVEMGRGSYETDIVDEEAKININTATPQLLRAMVEFYGVDKTESEDIANAIYDYRDQDDRAVKAAAEYENDYYGALKAGRKSRRNEVTYVSPNEPYLSVEQLLDVYGVDREMFYGKETMRGEDADEDVRNAIAMGKAPPRAKAQGGRGRRAQTLPMKDIVTVYGGGGVNVNTASREVLTILFYAASNLGSIESAEAAADSVLKLRGEDRTGKRKNTDPEKAFKSFAELQKAGGVDAGAVGLLQNASQFGVRIAFNSNTFVVTGIGKSGNVEKRVTSIVRRTMDVYNPDDARLVANRRGSQAARKRSPARRANEGQPDDNFIRVPAIRVLQWVE